MDILPFADMGATAWDAFCDESREAWLRHTTTFMTFGETMGEENHNLSFSLMEGGTIRAVVPIMVQTQGGVRVCSVGGHPTPYPALAEDLTPHERVTALDLIFGEIDRRAREHHSTSIRMFVDPLTEPVVQNEVLVNPLLERGYRDTSIHTSCVDLTQIEETLLQKMASRRRRYITAAERTGTYSVEVFDAHTITKEVFDAYVELYSNAAGRVVWSEPHTQGTLNLIRAGAGLLVLLRASGESGYRAGHMVMLYKQRAYDLSSAIVPAYRHDHDIGAVMQWESMRYLKHSGYSHYEIGWLLPQTEEYSHKERSISHFKSLFGGEVLPLFRGEKYYNAEDSSIV